MKTYTHHDEVVKALALDGLTDDPQVGSESKNKIRNLYPLSFITGLFKINQEPFFLVQFLFLVNILYSQNENPELQKWKWEEIFFL